MNTVYTTKDAKRIAMIKEAHKKVINRKAFAVRVRIEDILFAKKVTLDKGNYT
mgnify:FL=1